MTTIPAAERRAPGRVQVSSPAPVVDDRDLADEDVVAANIAADVRAAREDRAKRRRFFTLAQG